MADIKRNKFVRVLFTIIISCIILFILLVVLALNIKSAALGAFLGTLSIPLSIFLAILLKNIVFRETMQEIAEENNLALAEKQRLIESYLNGKRVKAIRDDVVDLYNGYFFIINKRIIFMNDEAGFVLPLDELVAKTIFKDGIGLQDNRTTFTILIKDTDIANAILTGALKNLQDND